MFRFLNCVLLGFAPPFPGSTFYNYVRDARSGALAEMRAMGFEVDSDIPIAYEYFPPIPVNAAGVAAKTHLYTSPYMALECVTIGDTWFELSMSDRVRVLIHEFFHVMDHNIIDIAYEYEPTYLNLTEDERWINADSLTELVMTNARHEVMKNEVTK